ncbi:MAG: helix-turn-helix transcriptional regulator [Elusimicrobia bacterium]|nr:helix-turn-helix transcriptional regulator [Elusimicrobiota bacterium]
MAKKNIYIALGKRIQEERKNLNMTQEELAEKINVTPKFISFMERGLGLPSVETLISLSKALSVSMDDLVSGKKIKKNEVLANQIIDLLSDLSDKQQKQFFKALKEIKKSFE